MSAELTRAEWEELLAQLRRRGGVVGALLQSDAHLRQDLRETREGMAVLEGRIADMQNQLAGLAHSGPPADVSGSRSAPAAAGGVAPASSAAPACGGCGALPAGAGSSGEPACDRDRPDR